MSGKARQDLDSGSFQVQRGCINQLKSDHQMILQALDVLREMTRRIENNGDVERNDVLELLAFFNTFAHEYHDAKEQFLLIPALADGGVSLEKGPLSDIMSDHFTIYAAIEQLRGALHRQDDTEFVELATNYCELLTTHIFNEDRFLFATIEETLTGERDAEILRAFDAFDPRLRESSQITFDTAIKALGRKYCVPQCI